EYDDDRSGNFDPLRFVKRKDLQIVLGLITSKYGELENPEDVKRRINEAARFVSLDQLCLSPQCGFASTEEGNLLTEEQQWAKLRHVIDIANDVWR
ncbi:5-methyltetrahydropteroyltriglutamate--homocysteine S-methyltransferase, partial [Bacillus sp. LR--39]